MDKTEISSANIITLSRFFITMPCFLRAGVFLEVTCESNIKFENLARF
jgi:hypothetical protein